MLSKQQIKNLSIPSPKRSARRASGWSSFFPYYAGYPDAFADAMISQIVNQPGSTVFDPWNGSGTSTYSAAKLGQIAIGYDINPVMALVAKARLLPISELPSLMPLVEQIFDIAEEATDLNISGDPLLNWFGPTTAAHVRSLERSIAKHLIPRPESSCISRVSSFAASFYVALFTVTTKFAQSLRGSNPTWTRAKAGGVRRIAFSFSKLKVEFRKVIQAMEAEMSVAATGPSLHPPKIEIRDSASDGGEDFLADLILTSPPYCTRIDYTAATRIELAILSTLFPLVSDELSRDMLGTVKVPKRVPDVQIGWGPTANRFLKAVADHPSKASQTYYLKNHLDYFDKLYRSLELTFAKLRPGGIAIMVLQDSYYKDVHNDLPTVVVEMAANLGPAVMRREPFQAKRLLSGVHKHASKYRSSNSATEEVLVFQG